MRSTYFSHGTRSEKNLYEDLIIEQLKIYGHEVHYMPRENLDTDQVLGNTTDKFTDAHMIEMYVEEVNGFAGQGDLIGKFGLDMRDELTFVVARRSFELLVDQPSNVLSINRPREGDVIYFPLNKKLYTINFVEHEPVFYQMGALQFYELRLEMFEYAGERLNTGLHEIDKLETGRSMDVFIKSQLVMETGDPELPLHIETGQRILLDGITENDQDDRTDSENDFFETNADGFLDFSDGDPFSEGGNF